MPSIAVFLSDGIAVLSRWLGKRLTANCKTRIFDGSHQCLRQKIQIIVRLPSNKGWSSLAYPMWVRVIRGTEPEKDEVVRVGIVYNRHISSLPATASHFIKIKIKKS